MSLLIVSCFCCMIIMFTPPPTSVRTAVGERPRGAALSQSFLAALLLSCYCTQAADVVRFALFLLYALPDKQAISFCLFFDLVAALLFNLWSLQPRGTLCIIVLFQFWVALSCFCIFCGVANQEVLVERLQKL